MVSGRISSAPLTNALARVRPSLVAVLVGLFVLVSALLGCLPKAQAQGLAQDPAASPAEGLIEAADPGATAAAFLEQALSARSDVMVVLDQSLSLYDPWNAGESRLQRVQQALPDAMAALPNSARTGVVTFGHRRAGDCADIQVLTNPVERPLDAQLMQDWQTTPSPAAGERPLADAIETAAARIMRSSGDHGGAIVVLTDGLASCGGDVCALATRLGQHQIPVHLVGLGLEQGAQMALSCLPARTGGALLLAAAGSDVQPHIDAALARSHAANTRRNAAQIARLVLQDQDLVLRDLGRVDGDIERLDEQVAALEASVQAIAETDLLTAQLSGEAPDTTPLSADIDRVQGEADILLAQLGDREQMLGRFSTQAQGWEGPSVGLQQRADFAARLSMASPDLVPLSENMREGYRQIMERGLAVDAELTARLGRSQALKARLAALETGLQDARAAADEALGLAARIEAGATVTPEAVPEAAAAHPVIAAVLERDQTIAALRTEQGQLAQQLLDTRSELNAARQEIVDVTRQREAAMAGVENARLLLNRLRENQDQLKASLTAATALNATPTPDMDTQDAADQMAEAALRQRLEAVLGERDSLRADQARLQQAVLALTAEREATLAQLQQAQARIDLLFSKNQELISAAGVCSLSDGSDDDHLAAASGAFPLSPPDLWLTGSAVRHSEARALENILGKSLSSLRARRGRVNLDGLRLEPRVGVAPDAAPSLILAASASTTDD